MVGGVPVVAGAEVASVAAAVDLAVDLVEAAALVGVAPAAVGSCKAITALYR